MVAVSFVLYSSFTHLNDSGDDEAEAMASGEG